MSKSTLDGESQLRIPSFMQRFFFRPLRLSVVCLFTACASTPSAPRAAATPEASIVQPAPLEPTLPGPFVGTVKTEQGPELRVALWGGVKVSKTHSVLAFALPGNWKEQAFNLVRKEDAPKHFIPDAAVHISGADIQLAFVSKNETQQKHEKDPPTSAELKQNQEPADASPLAPTDLLWVLTAAPQKLQTARFFASFEDVDHLNVWSPTERKLRLERSQTQAARVTLQLADWGLALQDHFERDRWQLTNFEEFASDRLFQLFEPESQADNEARNVSPTPLNQLRLSKLLGFSSGWDSIEGALKLYERGRGQGAATADYIPIAQLKGPTLRRHDWSTMLQGLAVKKAMPSILAAAPADFYLFHARSLRHLNRLLGELETYIEPMAQLLKFNSDARALTARSRRQLGLGKKDLSFDLDGRIVEELLLVGSDPFIAQGSDLTLVLQPKKSQRPALLKGLDAALRASLQGAQAQESTFELQGMKVRKTLSPDGAVSRLFTEAGGLLFLSNSKEGLRQVLSTLAGKHPALKDEQDFQYLWRRDAEVQADVLFYAGDRFIELNIGPERRIADVRRLLARHELERQSYAFLLSALLKGEMAKDREQLLQEGLLTTGQMTHFDGSPISGAHEARSRWGTARQLKPLIDLPAVTRVTQAEQQTYEAIVRRYERSWGDFVDPIAFRCSFENEQSLKTHLRILPVFSQREMRQLDSWTGPTRILRAGPSLGLSAALALQPEDKTIKWLRNLAGPMLSNVDWLGDYALVGLDDEPEALELLYRYAPEPKKEEEYFSKEEQLAGLPLYGVLDIENRPAFSLFLTVLENKLLELLGLVEAKTELVDGVLIKQIPLFDTNVTVHYALGETAFFASTQKATLLKLLKEEKAGHLPQAVKKDGAQVLWGAESASPSSSSALITLAQWWLEYVVRIDFGKYDRGSQRNAEYFSAALSFENGQEIDSPQLRTLSGRTPRTLDGLTFRQSPYGALDPARGHRTHPSFSKIPAQGSDIERLLHQLKSFEFDVAFDEEAPAADGEVQKSFRGEFQLRRQVE